MQRLLGVFLQLMVLVSGIALTMPANAQSTDEIKRKIIEQSIASYSGNCPCPYNTDRAGRRCGARSAYSRPGGASPKCYPEDVSEAEVRAFRQGG